MPADTPVPVKRWEEATRDIAPLLQDRTCIVVVGEQDDDAANMALALAKGQVRSRRVAIVDAVGELAPLQRLLPRDARPHGVIDHFLHGVSLRKIAHPSNPDGTLFVLPSGVGPFDYGTLLRRERWRRLTMAFRGEGALLCIVLPAAAEGLAGFVEDTDGIVLVGEVAYPEARHVIAKVPRVSRMSADANVVAAASTQRPGMLARVTRQAPARRAALLAAGLLVLVVGGAVLALDQTADPPDDSVEVRSATAAGAAQRAGSVADESDSANAALYSVDVVMLNSLAAASRQLSNRLGSVSAATFSPLHLGVDSARWYRVLVGAWHNQRQADSALLALRAAGLLEVGFGSVRRTPYAVRLADGIDAAAAMARAMELRAQGLPAYVLERDEGHAAVYAGAFETPSQAMALLDMFKRAGIDAIVAYRIGRGI